jgi:FkbM family methyltransferase
MYAADAIYRSMVPPWVRGPLWRLRTFGWKSAVARAHLALGKPIVRARSGDTQLYVDLRDTGVGRYLYFGGTFEPSETAFIGRHLRTGMTMIDVGANLGYHTTRAARLVGSTGRVLAIEPDPYNFALLMRNVQTNGLDNVLAENVALGAQPGRATLFRSPGNLGDHRLFASAEERREAVEVPVVRLDDLCREHAMERVDLVKMDVQGYEPLVLAGMSRTLADNPHALVITEFWPHGMEAAGSSAEAFFQLISAPGFAAYLLERGRCARQVDLDAALRALPEFDPCHPDYCSLTLVLAQKNPESS